MKKKIIPLLLAVGTIVTPILTTTTAYADQPGDPLSFTLPTDQIMNKSGTSLLNDEYADWKVTLHASGQLDVIWGSSSWSINIFDNSSYVGYTHATSGPPVYCAQVMLTLCNYSPGSVDGLFGPNTHQAIINFQQAHGLSVDATVGPNTWVALFNAI